jgi:hypothetical protein
LNFHKWWRWFLLLLPTICDAFNIITWRKKWDGKSLLQDFQTFTKKINDFKFNTNAQIWRSNGNLQLNQILSHLTFHEGYLHIIMWNLKKTLEEFSIFDLTKIYGN